MRCTFDSCSSPGGRGSGDGGSGDGGSGDGGSGDGGSGDGGSGDGSSKTAAAAAGPLDVPALGAASGSAAMADIHPHVLVEQIRQHRLDFVATTVGLVQRDAIG